MLRLEAWGPGGWKVFHASGEPVFISMLGVCIYMTEQYTCSENLQNLGVSFSSKGPPGLTEFVYTTLTNASMVQNGKRVSVQLHLGSFCTIRVLHMNINENKVHEDRFQCS